MDRRWSLYFRPSVTVLVPRVGQTSLAAEPTLCRRRYCSTTRFTNRKDPLSTWATWIISSLLVNVTENTESGHSAESTEADSAFFTYSGNGNRRAG